MLRAIKCNGGTSGRSMQRCYCRFHALDTSSLLALKAHAKEAAAGSRAHSTSRAGHSRKRAVTPASAAEEGKYVECSSAAFSSELAIPPPPTQAPSAGSLVVHATFAAVLLFKGPHAALQRLPTTIHKSHISNLDWQRTSVKDCAWSAAG